MWPALDMLQAGTNQSTILRALEQNGLPPGILDTPELLIPFRDMLGFYESTARILGQPSPGYTGGAKLGCETLGLYGDYILQANTFRAGLERAVALLSYNESGTSARFVEGPETSSFIYNGCCREVIGWRHHAELVVTLVCDLGVRFHGSHWKPELIQVDYKAPNHGASLEDYLEASVTFDADRIIVSFASADLSARNKNSYEVADILTYADIARSAFNEVPTKFAESVAHIVHMRSLDGHHDLDGLAKRLRMGIRTLQRRLEAENRTYRQILNSVQRDRAVALLTDSELTVLQVSKHLGFSCDSHFIRAFRSWTGKTPSEVRTHLA